MFKARLFAAVFLAAVATFAAAGTPEGQGSAGLGLGFGPGHNLANAPGFSYDAQTAWQEQLAADAPLWSGLAGGLKGDMTQSPNALTAGPMFIHGDILAYDASAELRAYPAAFMGKAFNPGSDANPDGWLLWPSFTLTYDVSKTNEVYSVGSGAHSQGQNIYESDQSFGYGLVLPLAAWGTLRGSYFHNSSEEESASFALYSVQNGGMHEGESLGLTAYVDLAKGAGSDRGRAFLPHLGRQGQLRLDLGWSRQLNFNRTLSTVYPYTTGSQTYSLQAATPVTSSLGLTLGVAQTELDHFAGFWGAQLNPLP
ncbi:MAG TPA: hypothetical protein VNZ67_01545, partial [bacterium]|nr:hypothetical protein [bacterium]